MITNDHSYNKGVDVSLNCVIICIAVNTMCMHNANIKNYINEM